MAWHLLRPLLWLRSKIDNYLRKHYQQEQLSELIKVQREGLRVTADSADLAARPLLQVRALEFVRSADPPTIGLAKGAIANDGGFAKIRRGDIWFKFPNDKTYDQHSMVPYSQIGNRKEEPFRFTIRRPTIDQIVAHGAIFKLKFKFFYADQRDREQEPYIRQYRYQWQKEFMEEPYEEEDAEPH